jgi:hypothetical protein
LNTKYEVFLSAKAAHLVTTGLQNVRTSFGCTVGLHYLITYKSAVENIMNTLM